MKNESASAGAKAQHRRPNVLFIMTDQQRYDTIAALGNHSIYTPNMDRLVRRGITLTNAYTTCPVCMPARYTIRTGREPVNTGIYENGSPMLRPGQAEQMEGRCGAYLARTMKKLGYRTFGVGKFHAEPRDEDLGYEVHTLGEELFGQGGVYRPEHDGYYGWLKKHHPEFAHIEQPHGERSEMYFQPQTSALPAELNMEAWAANRAVELIGAGDGRPYFGFVSFVGPHPPLAPPIPFNRMYDPDRMTGPVRGEAAVDHLDPFIPDHAFQMYADDLSDFSWRLAKARYYGEVSYIDQQIGKILDAVDRHPDADNTLICFFSDHGEMMGDHRACQKANFFEQAAHIPMLVSWPARLPAGAQRGELAALTDLFALATAAGGELEKRDGIDLLGVLENRAAGREHLIGLCGFPNRPGLRVMVRRGDWKYVFIANGGGEMLFNIAEDPHEVRQLLGAYPYQARELRKAAVEYLKANGVSDALDGDDLRTFPRTHMTPWRCQQFAGHLGIERFPVEPAAALSAARREG